MELCWRSLMTLVYWGWHLNPRWPLRSTFAQFRQQLLKGFISWVSRGIYFMIDCFLGYPFGVLCCSFWTTVLHCCAWLQVHLNLQYHVVSCANFLTGGVFDVTLHIIDVWLYYVCYTRSGVTQCILFMVLYLYHMDQCRLQCVLCSHIGIVLMHLLDVSV